MSPGSFVGQFRGAGATAVVPLGTGTKESITTTRALLGFHAWFAGVAMFDPDLIGKLLKAVLSAGFSAHHLTTTSPPAPAAPLYALLPDGPVPAPDAPPPGKMPPLPAVPLFWEPPIGAPPPMPPCEPA